MIRIESLSLEEESILKKIAQKIGAEWFGIDRGCPEFCHQTSDRILDMEHKNVYSLSEGVGLIIGSIESQEEWDNLKLTIEEDETICLLCADLRIDTSEFEFEFNCEH